MSNLIETETKELQVRAEDNYDFKKLLLKLGQNVNSIENAFLVFDAYEIYLRMHPDTGKGKANVKGRDKSIKPFRVIAAEISHVAVETIDSLLQVGRMTANLCESTQEALKKTPIKMVVLRKLAIKKLGHDPEKILSKYLEEEKVDPKKAMVALKTTLKMTPKTVQESLQAVDDKKAAKLEKAEKSIKTFNERGAVVETTDPISPGECTLIKVGEVWLCVNVELVGNGKVSLGIRYVNASSKFEASEALGITKNGQPIKSNEEDMDEETEEEYDNTLGKRRREQMAARIASSKKKAV